LIASPFAVIKGHTDRSDFQPRFVSASLESHPKGHPRRSPVRWIETQDLFFEQYKFERFVEIGASPTLSGYTPGGCVGVHPGRAGEPVICGKLSLVESE
jgi:hypothetical protein